MKLEIVKVEYPISSEEISFLNKELINVREEVEDNPYIKEAIKVLSAGGCVELYDVNRLGICRKPFLRGSGRYDNGACEIFNEIHV